MLFSHIFLGIGAGNSAHQPDGDVMLDKHFRTICIVLGVFMLGFVLHIVSKPGERVASPSVSYTFDHKPLSPEWMKAFTREVVELCARLPVGDRNRPSVAICGY